MNDLGARGLLGTAQAGGVVTPFGAGRFSAPTAGSVDLGDVALTDLGWTFYDLADLGSITNHERITVASNAIRVFCRGDGSRRW